VVMIHRGKVLANGTLDQFRAQTGQTDLDDIFVHFVNQSSFEEELAANEF